MIDTCAMYDTSERSITPRNFQGVLAGRDYLRIVLKVLKVQQLFAMFRNCEFLSKVHRFSLSYCVK